MSRSEWESELDRRVVAAGLPPVIYIHGYFNNQDDAQHRALAVRALLCPRETRADRQSIQVCSPKRPVVSLTWPSHDQFAKYTWDEANAEWAVDRAVAEILKIARRHKGAIVVAHSMGNRILLRAALAAEDEPQLFEHLVLAAPDVDRGQIAALLKREQGLGFPATIYASRRDQALSASWRTHGYPRAGDLSHWVTGRRPGFPYTTMNRSVIVDTTDVPAGRIGHAAFIESSEGAADLCHVLAGDELKPGRKEYPEYTAYMVLIRSPVSLDDCAHLAQAAARIARR